MQTIIKNKDQYYEAPIDAIITKKTVIPGQFGKQIDIKQSYQKMKPLGYFNQNLLVYQKTSPKKSVYQIYDKVIIPSKKNQVSLIFEIDSKETFLLINQILKTYDVKANILYNQELKLTSDQMINTLSTTYQEDLDYCLAYTIKINKECQQNKKYTILSKYSPITNYHLTNTKAIIQQANLLIYHFNQDNITNLELIIKFLKNNQYHLLSIEELISEEN